MSDANDAWQEWLDPMSHVVASPGLIDCTHKAFMAGYKRALEDAAALPGHRLIDSDVALTSARTHRGCDACSTMWDDAWVDLIVPDPIWAIISPNSPDGESGGYLCARCLTGRLVEHGLSEVPVRTFGKPFWIGLAL